MQHSWKAGRNGQRVEERKEKTKRAKTVSTNTSDSVEKISAGSPHQVEVSIIGLRAQDQLQMEKVNASSPKISRNPPRVSVYCTGTVPHIPHWYCHKQMPVSAHHLPTYTTQRFKVLDTPKSLYFSTTKSISNSPTEVSLLDYNRYRLGKTDTKNLSFCQESTRCAGCR